VIALDSFDSSPGSHSKYVSRRITTAGPRLDPVRFLVDVRDVVGREAIDLVLPTFEEAFYLAPHMNELAPRCEVFTSRFEDLLRLHNKGSFNRLVRALGLSAPRSTLVTSRRALHETLPYYPRYVARPVYSRGATRLLTNEGPLAGVVYIGSCDPTEELPWIVQEWIDGHDLCTFSIARRGRVTGHVSYIHPVELEHGSGIVIESVDAPDTLEAVQRIVGDVGYHGQLSCDFRRSADGALHVLEANPRACNGVCFMPDEVFLDAVLNEPTGPPHIIQAGATRSIALAVIRSAIREPRSAARALRYLFSRHARDVFAAPDDLRPALYQLLTYGQILRYRRWAGPKRERRTELIEAYGYDFVYDGQPIP
jgi:predicted ATP-grasp superfamily ATP-dependent carboligase